MAAVMLFDIDMTIMRSNGAGSAAMTRTLLEMTGAADAFAGMTFAGRTDRSLLREALTRCGHRPDSFEQFCDSFEERYYSHLQRELPARGAVLLPGVVETLTAVAGWTDVRCGLATGNFRRAAQLKLDYFGLWHRFVDGGFAEDGEHRDDLVAAAIRRMTRGAAAGRVIVIGDSVHDVQSARANGAVAVGVCTGTTDRSALEQAGADRVVDDLSDSADWLRRLVAGS